jgi:hypothetical protein
MGEGLPFAEEKMMSTQAHMPAFGYQPNRFILHNASPEEVRLRWGGVQFTVPPVDKMGKAPAQDADGDNIPGTLVLQDAVVMDRDGSIPEAGSPPNWLAFEAIRNVLGVDTITKQAIGSYHKSGISFLPNGATKEVVATVREDGKRRYMEHLVEWAQYTVSTYEARVSAARMAGVQPAPPDQDYAKSLLILKQRESQMKIVAVEQVAAAESPEDKLKVMREMLLDPKVRAQLGKEYSIRKRGHLEEETSQEG